MSPLPLNGGTQWGEGADMEISRPASTHPLPPADGSRATSLQFPSGRLLHLGSALFVLFVALILFYGGARKPMATTVPFLLSTLVVAILWGRGPAITGAVAASAAFNFFFVPPWDAAFSIPTVEEAVLLAGMLAIAVAVGTSIERMRRVRAEADQYAASERLQKVLLSCISHDLKTPLTGVIGSLSTLLEERALGQEGRQELLTIAYREAKQLDRFVTQTLEMSRLEAEAFRVRKERLDVRAVIDRAADHLREVFEERPCRVELPPRLPAVYVDAILFPHALINIIDNAAKYSPPGTPIEITACAGLNDVVISVADRGIGIPVEHLRRVFEKFSRLRQPASAAGVVGGTGLGLAIAKGIAEAHGGAIWAERRDGGGTIVSISLPLGGDPE